MTEQKGAGAGIPCRAEDCGDKKIEGQPSWRALVISVLAAAILSVAASTGAAEALVLAPNDYLEFLESAQAIETGSLTAPGVQPTVIPGPSEPVVIPEGG